MNPSDLPDSVLDAIHKAAAKVKRRSDELLDAEHPQADGSRDAFAEDILEELLVPLLKALEERHGTTLRRLSPETLSECRKVAEFAKLRENLEGPK